MSSNELARREHENLIAALERVSANADDALISRTDGVALILTGLPLRLFNQVIVQSDEASKGSIAAAVAIARERGTRFVVNLREGVDDRFVPLMEALGLSAISQGPWMPGMALYPARLDEGPRPAGDIEIIQVTDDAGVDDHVRTAAAGFELPEAILREIMSTKTANDPDLALYVGYAGGQPVTTGLGLRTGPTIGVYNISTVPAARGRGYGAAMTRRVANDGVRAGCDAAILQASEIGRPIYERLGYRTVVQYLGFGEPQRS